MSQDCFICLEEEKVSRPGRWLRVGFSPAMREVRSVCDDHVRRFERRDGWAIRPLLGAHSPEWRDAVSPEAWQEEINVVCAAVERAFPDKAREILPTLRSSGDHYSFVKWGMYVGIERDGYVHT